jgi:GTP-binding protein
MARPNLNKAEFIKSAAAPDQFVQSAMPRIAFAGKSNVGKSSVINRLLNRKNFARVGSEPGKTIHVNYFLIDAKAYFIDLPGYGFAKVTQQEQERWGKMMSGYFQTSKSLRLTLHLVDIRHEPTRDDVTMNRFLRQTEQPFFVVATKADKISKAQRQKNIALIGRALEVQPWQILPYSSETGEGRKELLKVIEDALKAGKENKENVSTEDAE